MRRRSILIKSLTSGLTSLGPMVLEAFFSGATVEDMRMKGTMSRFSGRSRLRGRWWREESTVKTSATKDERWFQTQITLK